MAFMGNSIRDRLIVFRYSAVHELIFRSISAGAAPDCSIDAGSLLWPAAGGAIAFAAGSTLDVGWSLQRCFVYFISSHGANSLRVVCSAQSINHDFTLGRFPAPGLASSWTGAGVAEAHHQPLSQLLAAVPGGSLESGPGSGHRGTSAHLSRPWLGNCGHCIGCTLLLAGAGRSWQCLLWREMRIRRGGARWHVRQ